MKSQILKCCQIFIVVCLISGCSGLSPQDESPQIYPIPTAEAQWIRDGQPIEWEHEQWFPQDNIEVLTDEDVYLLGEYEGVQIFVEKVDVRPFERLYAKSGKNQYRLFERKSEDKSVNFRP